MLNHVKLQKSRILTSEDEEQDYERPKFKKSIYFRNSKTTSNSPKQSTIRVSTQNDSSPQNIQNDTSIRLAQLLEEERQKNATLIEDNTHLKNQLLSNVALNSQFVEQKEKLLQELRILKENFKTLQQQKVVYFEQVAKQKVQIDTLSAHLKMNQEKIQQLDWQQRKNVDEINFQKCIESDLKKQNLLMKNKITYLATILKDYAQNKEQLKQTEVINKLIVEKLKNMEKEMKRMKEYICQNEKIVYGNIEFKNKIFDSYIQLEEFNKKAQKTSEIILEQLNTKLSFMENKCLSNRSREREYQNMIDSQQRRIKSLAQEMLLITRRNTELLDQIDSYKKQQRLSFCKFNPVHTNSSFVTKIIKQNHEQILQIKKTMNEKEDEIIRLQNNLQISLSSIKAKNQELQAMRKITLSEKKVESVLKENEVLNLAQQNNSLKRKVQQFTENQKKMKNQLAEKDRIIMAYVQNQKANKK